MSNLLKKGLVVFTSVAFALVMVGPVSAACSLSTPNDCTNEELVGLISDLLGQAEVEAAAPTGEVPAACQGITFAANLKLGSTGADVKCLQALLNTDSATKLAETGAGSPGNETSYFGSITKAAVEKFQTKYASEVLTPLNLTAPTGFFGAKSIAKANALLAAMAEAPAEEEAKEASEITVATECIAAGYYWGPTGCYEEGVEEKPASEITSAAECIAAGYYWGPTGCYSEVAPAEEEEEEEEVAGPLTVTLSADTPAGGNILAGEANKKVTSLVFTAGADADATINTLKVKSFGTADLGNADIANVKIFDGTRQIGITQQLIAGTAIFTFAPGISIPAGASKTLNVAVTIVGGATPSATVKMGVNAAADIGGTAFTATFPVVGNAYIIVAGGALGTVNVTPGAVVPLNNVGAGTKDVVLGNIIVSAGTNEDVNVSQFTVEYDPAVDGGSILDTDITNIRVSVDGTVQGTTGSFSMRRATVDFATPVLIPKGGSKVFQVVGDAITGAGRNVQLIVPADGVYGLGATSGVGIAGPAALQNLGAINAIAIAAGQLAVSINASTPQGAGAQYVKSTSPQVLGIYDIRAVGEDILLSSLSFEVIGLAASRGTITSIGLYNEAGSLISSNMVNVIGDADVAVATWDADVGDDIKTFALSNTIPANTVQKFYFKGITNGITAPDPATVQIQLQLGLVGLPKSIVGTGMSSSAQQGTNNITSNSQLALPAVQVNQGPLAVSSGDPLLTSLNQAVLSPTPAAVLGTLKVTALREDQSLRGLMLTGVPAGGDLANIAAALSGVAIYDGDTPITNFIAPVGDNVTFNPQDIYIPTTFTKGVAKTLKIVGNTLGSIDEGTIRWKLPKGTVDKGIATAAIDSLVTAGKSSGQTFKYIGVAIDLRSGAGATAAGTYTLNTRVLEIKKDAASPSDAVGRGTFKTYAIWELNAYGNTLSLDVTDIAFTSKTGLPAVADNPLTPGMFRLVDADTEAVIAATATGVATGTVTFTVLETALQVTAGVPKRIALQITTTDAVAWPANTSMQWTIVPVANVTVKETGGGVANTGFGGTTWSIPADTNKVNIGT